jgi:hypothetical protein
LYEELGSEGFVPITVALDRSADDPRPFIEGAAPKHPSLIDTEHRLAELYHIVNVPTILWIDEEGRICRPHDQQFGSDTFTQFHHKRSGPYLEMIRKWVRTGEGVIAKEEAQQLMLPPSNDGQAARAERTLAWALHGMGETEAAERHFVRAGELAPQDWTIRRGSMPIRGMNPFGPEFFELAAEGMAVFPMDAITPTRDDEAVPHGD